MLKIFVTILLVHSLAIIGLCGFGLVTGRFDSDKRAQYLATWRGETLVPPTEQVEVVEETESPQQASLRIENAEQEIEIGNRQIERNIEVLRSMQTTIKESRIQLQKDRQRLGIEKDAFDTQFADYNQKAKEEGFRKALKNYSQMKPKLVKEDFMKMQDEQVVRYLAQMKADVATKILEKFKTPQEQQKRLAVMELLKQGDVIKVSQNEKTN